jgi:hypothetical protein
LAAQEAPAMKIGKYQVEAHAVGTHQQGFRGEATLTWDEGNSTYQQVRSFDKVFQTMEEAIQHAYEQVHLRVANGDL